MGFVSIHTAVAASVHLHAALSKMKTGYLLLYNGVQWSGFILIVLTLLRTLRGGTGPGECACIFEKEKSLGLFLGGISTAYEKTAAMMMFCTALMLLEIIHAAFGIVKGSLTATILQVNCVCILQTQCHTTSSCWMEP